MDIKNLNNLAPFITKDGSEIRELLAHRNSVIRHQSLAEARIPVGASTQEHYHAQTEEIYYITHGAGRIRIAGETRDVKPGDAIAIPPGSNTSCGTPATNHCGCYAAARPPTSTTNRHHGKRTLIFYHGWTRINTDRKRISSMERVHQ